MNDMDRYRDALNASGLWSSYGDFAEATGMAPEWGRMAPLVMGQVNGELGARLALNSGVNKPFSDTEREAATRRRAAVSIEEQEVFGLAVDGTWPDAWRASVADLQRLAGDVPMTGRLRDRLHRRLALVTAIGADGADPRAAAARRAAHSLMDLLARTA